MYCTTLVFRLGKDFAHSSQPSQAFVTGNEIHAVQTTSLEPFKEAEPAGPVLLHALRKPHNFPITVLIDRNGYPNGYVLKLSASVPAQIDTVHVGVFPAL